MTKEYMNYRDAKELCLLRIVEDKISVVEATKEFMHLTNSSLSDAWGVKEEFEKFVKESTT